MIENEKKFGVLSQIIAAVVIALIAGGTSPWWWEKLFPPERPTAIDQSLANRRNTTGTWMGGTGIYKVIQEGNQVVWDGIGRFGNKVWHHRATGTIEGDTIYATMEELPDSNYPGIPGGARTEGTISSDWQTITWIGQNNQERVWHRK
ncbi:MAG: hypothetical protein ACREXX_21805 [Gammaproteobacteria bacterium]